MTYVFLDIETSGLDPKNEFITEVGAIKTDVDGRVIGMFNTYINAPTNESGTGPRELSEFIVEYTGITDKDLREHGMPLKDVIETLDSFLSGNVLVAQFAPFDVSFLEESGLEVPFFLCTRTMSYEVDATKKAGLKDLAARYGVKNRKEHSAMGDAQTTKQVFFKMREQIGVMNTVDLINVVGTSRQRKVERVPQYTEEVRDY